jgi:hypothetical protein
MKTLLWNGMIIYFLSLQEMSLFNSLKSQHNTSYKYENIIFLPDPINPMSKTDLLENYKFEKFNIVLSLPKLYNIVKPTIINKLKTEYPKRNIFFDWENKITKQLNIKNFPSLILNEDLIDLID